MNIDFSAKRKSSQSHPLLIVGDVSKSVQKLMGLGFFRTMIHIDDGGPIPSNRQFIVSETVPPGWTGETITADKFAETMDARTVKLKAQQKLSAVTAATTTSEQRSSRTTTTYMGGCCGGK